MRFIQYVVIFPFVGVSLSQCAWSWIDSYQIHCSKSPFYQGSFWGTYPRL